MTGLVQNISMTFNDLL